MKDDAAMPTDSSPLTVGACATLACLWEATAPKPGNVYRGADFDDLTYADFLASAAIIGPIIDRVQKAGVGKTVLDGIAATRQAVGTNVNLGMLLLIAPLAAVPRSAQITSARSVVETMTIDDTRSIYAAIRLAAPGGLGRVEHADVSMDAPPITPREAMALAADRDLVAQQYANGFAEVFWTADRIAAHAASVPLSDAIVRAYLELLSTHPDSLIARKCGPETAKQVSDRAANVLESLQHDPEQFADALSDLDFFLRADGHRRNPGTSADLIAAALFVLLRDGRVNWPVRFYAT